jgi:hypothetical protein
LALQHIQPLVSFSEVFLSISPSIAVVGCVLDGDLKREDGRTEIGHPLIQQDYMVPHSNEREQHPPEQGDDGNLHDGCEAVAHFSEDRFIKLVKFKDVVDSKNLQRKFGTLISQTRKDLTYQGALIEVGLKGSKKRTGFVRVNLGKKK